MKGKFLQEPGLSELIYTIATTAPISAKRHLPEKLFNATRTASGARRFAAKSSTEQKKEYLSYLGFKTFLVVSNVSNVWALDLKEILTGLLKKQGTFQESSDTGVFIISDKRIAILLESMAALSSSKAYAMGLELVRSRKGEQGWPTKLNRREIDEIHKKEEQYNAFVKLALSIDHTIHSSQLDYNLKPPQIRILLYLFLKRNTYISHEKLVEHFIGIVPRGDVSIGVRSLLENLLIQRHLDNTKKDYTITARGILFVSEILNHAAKLFNFND